MTSVCYFIMCVNLLYCFDQAVSYIPFRKYEVRKVKINFLVNPITAENQDEYLAKTITPYWNMTYDKQLELKQNSSIEIVDMIVTQSDRLKNLMTYKICKIIPSPVTEAYRNRDEFYIRRGIDGNPKTVGFALGKFSYGMMFAVRPTKITSIREGHKRVAQVYEDFIRLSPVKASNNLYDDGYWNALIVRSNEAGDIMATVTVKSKGFSNETIQNQTQALAEYFLEHLPDITLYHQQCSYKRCSDATAPFSLLYGQRYITEVLNGFEFKISPDSVFPNNKLGIELLYDTIIRLAKLQHNTTVLDMCSGIGTNSIVMSKFARRVFGFESVKEAIEEANYYTHFNNIRNVQFLYGRVDRNLNNVLRKMHPSADAVAILNHRRAGLGSDVITSIRKSRQISRMVYIFYKHNSPETIKNFVDLCSDRNLTLPPFRLTKVIPIDLLPQTEFVELILLFHREPVGKSQK